MTTSDAPLDHGRPRSRWPGRLRLSGWSRRRLIVAVVLTIVLAAGGAVIGYNLLLRLQHYTSLEAVPAGSLRPVPSTRPVILIVFENKSDKDILGAAEAPYLNGLIQRGAIGTDYQAVAHPSQPNYLALFSGSPQGITDDRSHDLSAPTLADQIEAAGRTWRVFAENLPADGCYTGEANEGGPDGAGLYVRKHNPAISFTSISGSPSRCANIQPMSRFAPDAADFIWVVPNMCHVMHDCAIADGDAWLRSFAGPILESPAFGPGGTGVLYITFDEGADKSRSNEIVTLAIGPTVRAGVRSDVAHSHYSLLRTIETGLGLPCLADACAANTLGEMFQP
jgi:acid phosphatase